MILKKILTVAKAIAATVVPAISVALVENHLDWKPLVAAAASALLVYFIPNAQPEAELIQDLVNPASDVHTSSEAAAPGPPIPPAPSPTSSSGTTGVTGVKS